MRVRRVSILVNGSSLSAAGIRARELASRLPDGFATTVTYRSAQKNRAVLRFLSSLVRDSPDVVYVVDMAYSGVLAASIYKAATGARVIVDTGDAIAALARLTGSRGAIGIALTSALETLGHSVSSTVIVRSHPHAEMLQARGIIAVAIPDGVDTAVFSPQDDPDIRRELGVEGYVTVGILGSIIWNKRWQICYGWDLVRALAFLRDYPVRGVVVGDGSGLRSLKCMAEELGVADKIAWVGRRPYTELPRLLSAIDICLSTQSDDEAGWVRTTGKLPLYLACGRFVLASRVGEAARVLPEEMLLSYYGTRDDGYPERLAQRIATLIESGREQLVPSQKRVALARAHFEYSSLAERLATVLAG